MDELNKAQMEAVNHKDGPALIIAGAGTGKTKTLVHRVAKLIEDRVAPESILLLTFTNKAALEMKERSAALCEKSKDITACTYHSFCLKELRNYAGKVRLPYDFNILSITEEEDIVNLLISAYHYDRIATLPKAKKILSMISKAVNTNTTLENVIEDRFYRWKEEILKIQRGLENYKKAHGLLNFDDILLYFRELVTKYPSIARELEAKYLYIMIDEYQDTNPLQDEIIEKIRSNNKNLFVVGDDMQSIYGFRGAEVQNILNFPKKYPGCHTIFLTENYRSSQEILDLANYVVTHATEGYQKDLKAQFAEDLLPEVHNLKNQTAEAKDILQMVQNRHKEGIPYHDMAILYRNSFQATELELQLTAQKIPYVKYGGIKFTDRKCIQDLLAFMRIYRKSDDPLAWFHVLQLYEEIGKAYARELSTPCAEKGSQVLLDPAYQSRTFSPYLPEIHEQIETASKLSFPETLQYTADCYTKLIFRQIRNRKMKNEAERTDLYVTAEKEQKYINQLLEIAARYHDVNAFLDDILLDNVLSPEEDRDTLVLSTIHSVKGLEFDSVFILDCVEQVFPNIRKNEIGTKRDNEELRCMYVAVTRAKKRLVMYTPNYAKTFRGVIRCEVSHYLAGGRLHGVFQIS